VERSNGGALLKQTPFKVLEFDFGQVGFQEILIAIDILEVGTHPVIVLVHSQARKRLIQANGTTTGKREI
jgi:hypothetical protein